MTYNYNQYTLDIYFNKQLRIYKMETNTKNMGPVISTGERKCSTIGLTYGVTFRAPAITTRQSTQHGRQNKKAYRVNNSQSSKLVISEDALCIHYLTHFEHICSSF